VSGRRRDRVGHSPYPRVARVNEVLREVVAETLERLADTDDRLSMLTVTGVVTSSDLAHATVYLSSLEDEALQALEDLRGEVQFAIGSQVRMKRTPHLEFVPDPAVAHGMRVEEILRRIHAEGAGPDLSQARPGPAQQADGRRRQDG
jgi:ribosome-binding factor A